MPLRNEPTYRRAASQRRTRRPQNRCIDHNGRHLDSCPRSRVLLQPRSARSNHEATLPVLETPLAASYHARSTLNVAATSIARWTYRQRARSGRSQPRREGSGSPQCEDAAVQPACTLTDSRSWRTLSLVRDGLMFPKHCTSHHLLWGSSSLGCSAQVTADRHRSKWRPRLETSLVGGASLIPNYGE